MRTQLQQRRGAVGMLLIVVMIIAVVLLPLSVTLIRQLQSWLLICQARQLIEETMNSCLLLADAGALSDGQLKFSVYQLEQHLERQLNEQIPAALAPHFYFDRIELITRPLQPKEVVWHASRDDLSWPILICHARITDYRGHTISIKRSVICRFGRAATDPGLAGS